MVLESLWCFSLEREVPESVAWGKGRIQVYFTFLVYLWFSKRIMSLGLFQGGVLTIPDNLNSWSFFARTTKMLKSLNFAAIPKSGTPNVNQTFVKFNDLTDKILKINISNSLKMSTCWNFKYQQTCQQKWPPGDEWLASDFASWSNSFSKFYKNWPKLCFFIISKYQTHFKLDLIISAKS